tara:strand:+ start:5823 stop:6374 length:552 start_codon:yes stop_codon:yes gene_type:complete
MLLAHFNLSHITGAPRGTIADMRGFLVIVIAISAMLTGCTAYVTKENSSAFDTWELCTLLYDPHSLYSGWISMEDEDSIIKAELKKRGFLSKADCSIDSIAQAKCDDYGVKSGTSEYAKCRLDTEHYINMMKQMKKAAHEAEEAAATAEAQQLQNAMKTQQIERELQWEKWNRQRQQLNESNW